MEAFETKPFEYRTLELLAQYDSRFALLSNLWLKEIHEVPDDLRRERVTPDRVMALIVAMVVDATAEAMPEMEPEKFGQTLGKPGDSDIKIANTLNGLGLWNPVSSAATTYFAARRNILDDQRGWVRWTDLVMRELEIRAC